MARYKKVAKKKDRSQTTRPSSDSSKAQTVLFDMGLPDSLEEAIVLFYALAFGPIPSEIVVEALKQAGMTMPHGGRITRQKIAPYFQKLEEEELLVTYEDEFMSFDLDARGGLECEVDLRWASFDRAQEHGWLVPFGRVLQQVDPGELSEDSMEFKWSRRRFQSVEHARRDLFLAMEAKDQAEYDRLAQLCRQDGHIRDLIHVLYPICMDPLHPDYLSCVDTETEIELLYAGLHTQVFRLHLDHPIFEYVRNQIKTVNFGDSHEESLGLAGYLAKRDILYGDVSSAQALLTKYPNVSYPGISGQLALLTGDLDTAKAAFTQSHKKQGKGKQNTIAHLSDFTGLLHVALLVQSPNFKDRNLVKTWLNWVEDSYCPYNASYEWLDRLLDSNQDFSDDMPERLRIGPRSFDLEEASFLIFFLLQHYCCHAKLPSDFQQRVTEMANTVLARLEENKAYWPCYQIVSLLDKLDISCDYDFDEADRFFESSGLMDLSELWSPKEVWENQLRALEELIGPKVNGKPTQQEQRLGWKLKPNWDYDPQTDFGADSQRAPVFAVVPVEQKMTKKGGWTKGREVALSRVKNYHSEGLNFLSDQDIKVAKLIRARSGRRYTTSCTLSVTNALLALVGHENVFWDENPFTPVEITSSEPQVRILPVGDHLEITIDPVPFEEGKVQTVRVLHDAPNRLRIIQFLPMHVQMADVMGKHGIVVPESEKHQAIQRLQGLSQYVAIQSNVAMGADHAQAVDPDSRPILRLQRLGQGLQAEMVVLPLGEGSQRSFAPGQGSRHLIDTLNGAAVQTQRDLDLENELLNNILEQVPLLRDFPHTNFLWHLDDNPLDALSLLEQLQALPSDTLNVLWPKGNPITVRTVSSQQFQVAIRSAKDWFELEGQVQVDEDLVYKMREFLDTLNQAEGGFIRISDSQYLSLTKQFRRELNLLQASGSFKGKGNTLQLHPLAAIGLDDWKDEVLSFQADQGFHANIDRFQALESYHPEVPSTLQTELRPYQQEGFIWLGRLAQWGVGACLADDMGLGKTIEALALILLRTSQGPSLVVAPTSVCANWISEVRKFAPTLNPIRLGIDDQGKRQEILDSLKPFDLLVCTYTLLQQEAEALRDVRFSTIVLDEAQAIKNPGTKRSQAAMGLQGDFRMVCTGTPIENRLLELWNLSRFINPGLLGSQKHFTDRFVRPIEVHSDPLARHSLKSLMTPFVLRRTKSQVLEDLPPRTELLRLVELSPEENALHESLRQGAIERLEQSKRMAPGQKHLQVLAELMKLRRCCCNPRLVVPNCGLLGSKLQVFAELVEELRDNHHKALVFSQFVDHLSLLRDYLDTYEIHYQYLDGQTPPKKRQERIDDFQNGQGDLFLISLKAGGTGLNLTAADYVIHMDPWWNPAVEDQASDRAHRIGQTRPVTIYRLVAQGTIEEKIVQLHHQKRDLADSLLQGTDSAHRLSADDLIALLKQS